MRSFAEGPVLELVPAALVRRIGEVDAGKGRQQWAAGRSPRVLERMRVDTRTESVVASSAIEGIVVPKGRAAAVLAGHEPTSRDEQELAGYRSALDDVFNDPIDRLTLPRILAWHRTLLRASRPDIAGSLKVFENAVVDRKADGTETPRFQPVGVAETPMMLAELADRYEQARVAGRHHPLILIAATVLDFLVIHPFEDGNGRVARIMTTALLERDDYQVGRYVPIEALIAERGDEYKAALGASTAGWHDSTHDVWPWTSFFVDMLAMAYDTFTETVRRGLMDPTELVHDWLRAKAPPGFSMAEARRALPALSPHAITTALNAARDSGELRLTGHGRGARWHLVDPGK